MLREILVRRRVIDHMLSSPVSLQKHSDLTKSKKIFWYFHYQIIGMFLAIMNYKLNRRSLTGKGTARSYKVDDIL